jgi:hypothetical protein
MQDSWGDGWNGATLTLTVDGTDHVYGTYFTTGSESSAMVEICNFESTTYDMNAGSYPTEISWNVTCGDISFSGD